MAIKLRKKPLSNGKNSLYLDYWNGETREYEFLKLYLYKRPADPVEKQHNKDVLKTAEAIRAKREHEAGANEAGVKAFTRAKANFLSYYQTYLDKYTKKDVRMIRYALEHLREFAGVDYLPAKAVTEAFCEEFREWLGNRPNLSGETPHDYFARLKKVLKQATRDKVFQVNPAQYVENKVKANAIGKDVLTVEELQALAKAACGNAQVKRAFLFACNTGLRFCDVLALRWKHIQGGALAMPQQKTGERVAVNLNATAQRLLGVPGKPEEAVFTLPSHTGTLKVLRYWKERAGLQKKVTFHVARHSFATNLLIYETDVKTVSSLLGHTTMRHTQKYVRVVESLKQQAVNRLPEIEL